MTRKIRRYSKEFKAEAVRTVLEQGLSVSEGSSLLSIPEGTLGQWVTAARKGVVYRWNWPLAVLSLAGNGWLVKVI